MHRAFSWRLVALVAAVSSCTLIAPNDTTQCDTLADCTARGGEFDRALYCSDHHLCVEVRCTSSDDCRDAVKEEPTICRKRDGVCVRALSGECRTVMGNLNGEVFGAVLSLTGPNSYLGIPELGAIRLGVSELERYSGLPPAGDRASRTGVGVVACDDRSDALTGVHAATHLVTNLGLDAIIGTSTSGNTIKVSSDVSVPRGAMLIAPSSTSIAITKLLDEGLVWRTAPADLDQVKTLGLLLPALEAVTSSARAGGPMRAVLLHKGDPYGVSYSQALVETLRFNDRTAEENVKDGVLTVINYGIPEDPTQAPDYPRIIRAAVDAKPHAVFVIGLQEAVTTILSGIEGAWSTSTYRPRYFFGTVISGTEVVDSVGTNDGLRTRILGVVPGTTSATFRAFTTSFLAANEDGEPTSFGAANAYDAFYALVYGSFVTLRAGKKLDGRALADSMGALVPNGRRAIPVGAANLTEVFAELSTSGNVDLEGASGPLNFDLSTGDVSSDVQVMCLPANNGTAQRARTSGWYFDAATGSLQRAPGSSFPSCP